MNGLAGARVLLIGTGSHSSGSGLPNVPAVADTLTDLRAALIENCSVEPDAIHVVLDPASPVELGDAVASAAEAAEGVLLVYYIGHGLVSPGGTLHLATTRSDRRQNRVEHTALAYDTVRRYLRESGARSLVVVLDCCFSGRALDVLAPAEQEIVTLAEVEGGCVLTSASREEMALAPAGQRHTAFTGAFLRLLNEGDDDLPAEITLERAYRYLARSCRPRATRAPSAG